MAIFQSVNTVVALTGPVATGGIAGAPTQVRSTLAAGNSQVMLDSYVTAGTETTGDVIEWYPQIEPTATLHRLVLYFGPLGSGITVSFGKIDPNNSANTDGVHYMALSAAAVAGSVEANLNLWEQVGTDPAGDQSTGQTAPGFGSLPIIITSTIGGGTVAASITLKLVAEYTSGA
jgi:hypothetical protein